MAADGPGAIRRAFDKARAALTRFAPRPSTFAPAPDAEAAAVRAMRNMRTFRFHYAVIQWALLLASLAPRHRASMLFLMVASKGLLLYGAILKAFPNSALVHRLLDRRLVAVLFLALVLADLTASDAIANLLAALAAGVPLILLHAAFRVRDDLLEPQNMATNGEKEEEKATVVEKKEDGGREECAGQRQPPPPPRRAPEQELHRRGGRRRARRGSGGAVLGGQARERRRGLQCSRGRARERPAAVYLADGSFGAKDKGQKSHFT